MCQLEWFAAASPVKGLNHGRYRSNLIAHGRFWISSIDAQLNQLNLEGFDSSSFKAKNLAGAVLCNAPSIPQCNPHIVLNTVGHQESQI